jgi:hypothetical protein
MANWNYETATEYNFPNITLYKVLKDGEHVRWRFVSNDGYVMYNTTANNTELDSDTMEEIPIVYYYTNVDCPLNYNFNDFTWIAVLRTDVDENYIFE